MGRQCTQIDISVSSAADRRIIENAFRTPSQALQQPGIASLLILQVTQGMGIGIPVTRMSDGVSLSVGTIGFTTQGRLDISIAVCVLSVPDIDISLTPVAGLKVDRMPSDRLPASITPSLEVFMVAFPRSLYRPTG